VTRAVYFLYFYWSGRVEIATCKTPGRYEKMEIGRQSRSLLNEGVSLSTSWGPIMKVPAVED
jgi:hypothetical protein